MFKKLKSIKDQKDKEKIQDNLHEERLARCVPVARRILEIVSSNFPYMGDISDKSGQVKKEANDSYIKIAEEILKEMLDKNLYYTEKLFVFSLVEQALKLSQEKVQMSLERSLERAETKLFGKSVLDLTLQDLDYVLKSDIERDSD